MLPSVDSLRCFVAAAKLLNFRAAARTVALTPQAFSQRIRQLEDELHVRLFERTTRTVRLTPEGLRLVPVANEALVAVSACGQVVAQGTAFSPTAFLVGTRYELGLSWLEPQLKKLSKTLPWLTVNLYFGSGVDLVNRIRTMELDCGITSTRIDDPRLDHLKLHEETYVFVAAPSLLKVLPLKEREDAKAHTLLDIDDALPLFRYWRDAAPEGDTMRFKALRRLGTVEVIRRRVLAADGVAVLPRYLVEGDLQAKRLLALFPKVAPLHDHFRLVFRSEDARRPLFEAFAAELAKEPLK